MNNEADQILAVIDPTRTEQWAVQKALTIARYRNASEIVAYLCAHSDAECDDPERLIAVEIERQKLWLKDILADVGDTDIHIEHMVDWHADWREGICMAADKAGANLVIKRASGKPGSLGNSDRRLIRGLEGSGLFLVKQNPTAELKTVLIALDLNATDKAHLALNDAIVAHGKRICGESGNVQLHSVCAYEKSEKFKHPPDVAKTLGISRAQAHVRPGSAPEVIADVAKKVNADLLIIGNVGRRGLSGIAVGNTAEKILADIDSNVLVVVQESQASA